MDKRSLQRLISEWLRRLGLRGWKVDLRLIPHDELAAGRDGSYYAEVEPDPQHQRAIMRMCRAADMVMVGLNPDLAEETVVHELLHLRLDPMSSLARDAAFEVGLDALSEEFVRLARVERGRKRKQ